jgi:6-phosphogluconolactonase
MRRMPESRNMRTLLRWFPAISCLVCTLIGCGSGTTSAPVVSAPAPVSPLSTTKPKFAYTANQGASLSGYSVDPSTGALTPLSGFPVAVGLNPDAITHDPQNRFLIVGDNAAFMLHVYAIDSTTGGLSEISPSPYNTMIQPGAMAIDPSGTHLYLYRTGANDAFPGVSGNQMFAYNLSSTGVLSPVKGMPLPIGSPGAQFITATGIAVNTSGKFLYLQDTSNLYTFSIDAVSGALSLLQTLPSQYGGGIALDPGGTYLYAAGSNSLLSYGIDPSSGLLSLMKSTPTAEQAGAYTIALAPGGNSAYTIENNNDLVSYAVTGGVFVPVGAIYPGVYGLNIAVDPSGSFVYVPQACSNCPSGAYNVIHQFSITKTGGLAPLSTPTVAAGITPSDITVTSQ